MKVCRICGITEGDGAVIEPREILGGEEACQDCETAEKETVLKFENGLTAQKEHHAKPKKKER